MKIDVALNEQNRLADLFDILIKGDLTILEIGCRDGRVTEIIAPHYKSVTALDLDMPDLSLDNVAPVRGDVTALDFPDESFDIVLCSEVLEHIDPGSLQKACEELSRVARKAIVIGVPYKQDIRVGQTTCASCGTINPPFGHLNSFDLAKLKSLFAGYACEQINFIGNTKERTNSISALLNNLAGNPWGTYSQEEPCVNCGSTINPPSKNSFIHRCLSKSASIINLMQKPFIKEQAIWVHALFKK